MESLLTSTIFSFEHSAASPSLGGINNLASRFQADQASNEVATQRVREGVWGYSRVRRGRLGTETFGRREDSEAKRETLVAHSRFGGFLLGRVIRLQRLHPGCDVLALSNVGAHLHEDVIKHLDDAVSDL